MYIYNTCNLVPHCPTNLSLSLQCPSLISPHFFIASCFSCLVLSIVSFHWPWLGSCLLSISSHILPLFLFLYVFLLSKCISVFILLPPPPPAHTPCAPILTSNHIDASLWKKNSIVLGNMNSVLGICLSAALYIVW